MIAMSTLRWRADWLTWVGLGWALGHALELVSFLISREIGYPAFFLFWIPAAFAVCWTQRREWHSRLETFETPVRIYAALILLFAVVGIIFFAISLPEISTAPPYISDVWFHVNNAHEFRDHSPMQDPRIAGEAFNYHVFGYAASAAASLAVSEPIVSILTRYSGMSCATLLVLNLSGPTPVAEPYGGWQPLTIGKRPLIWWDDAVANRDAPVPLLRPATNHIYQKKLFLTPDVREALEWARTNFPADAVFMANAANASPYNAFCECRAFYETDSFHVSSHMKLVGEDGNREYFASHVELLNQWVHGAPGLVDRMTDAGVTHLFVDNVNGGRVFIPARLGRPVFANKSFKIYEVPNKTPGDEPAR